MRMKPAGDARTELTKLRELLGEAKSDLAIERQKYADLVREQADAEER